MCLRTICFRVVFMFANRRITELGAAASDLAKRIGPPPDLEPLKALVKGKALREATAMKALRAMGEGGWRTQADLHAVGRVPDDLCQACLASLGSFLHRCGGCLARAATRNAYKSQNIIHEAQSLVRADDPLFKFLYPYCKSEETEASISIPFYRRRRRGPFVHGLYLH